MVSPRFTSENGIWQRCTCCIVSVNHAVASDGAGDESVKYENSELLYKPEVFR